ncbi:MAG: alpha/beta hydrolase [Pseudomonadota bacterium]
MKLFTLAAIGAALISAASIASMQAMFALANAPALFFDGNRTEGITFSAASGQKLDIYTPERPPDQRFPVVVFFYGGSWEWGERTDYPFVGMTLANEGFVTVIPDYRKYPDIRFPTFVEDGAEALAWVKSNISAYGGDPDQVHVMGHSAGAHIAALLATDQRYLENAGAAGTIDSLVGLAGPYNFTPEADRFVDMFGPPEQFPQMQIPTFLDAGDPPMLLLHGKDDGTVSPRHSREVEALAKETNGCVKSVFYPDTGHIGLMTGFTWVFRDSKPMVRDVVDYLKARAKGEGC